MMHAFQYNGRASSDFGVFISGGGTYDAPERDVEFMTIPGRSGDLLLDNGRFKNIEIEYPCFIPDKFTDKWDPFRAHMMKSPSYHRLEDTYDQTHFRMAAFVASLNPEVVALRRAASFPVTFVCKPQRWLKAGEQSITYTQGSTIYNPTSFPAKPLLVVTGYGQVVIGDYRIVIAQHTNNRVWIDCDIQDAWFGTSNLNSVITLPDGVFPEIVPGSVPVTFSSTISAVQITPRWWTI